MSAQDAARRVLEEHFSPADVYGLPYNTCAGCQQPWPCDTAIVAQAVLDQQRVLGQVAAAAVAHAEAQHTYHAKMGLSLLTDRDVTRVTATDVALRAALALPDVAEALAAWRKEQGQ